MNDALRILLANEPLAYREILADAFREHRPGVEVLLVEPEALELGAISPGEDLVICSRLTRSVAADALAWVELYPGVAPWGVACVAGARDHTRDGLPEPACRYRPGRGVAARTATYIKLRRKNLPHLPQVVCPGVDDHTGSRENDSERAKT